MAFERPTLSELITRAQNDIESRLPASQARLPLSLANILARMNAGASHELYGALAWLAVNVLPNTQDEYFLGIWAKVFDLPRLLPTPATGVAVFTGAGSIAEGTELQGSNGVTYFTTEPAAVQAGEPTNVPVQAKMNGLHTNLGEGESLTLLRPIVGVNAKATAGENGLGGGADLESPRRWSERLMQRIQNPPMGGSVADYEAWALAAHASITNAWVLPATPTAGQVTIYLMAYGQEEGIPSAAVVEAVYDRIEVERPAVAQFHVFAPTPKRLTLTVALTPFTPELERAVRTNLEQLFQMRARPNSMLPRSHITEAISSTVGHYDHQLIGLVDDDLRVGQGEILILEGVNFEPLE